MTSDRIEIQELIVFANHGVLKEEKAMGQKFAISLSLFADMSRAAGSDDISDAVNYAEVCEFVTEFTKKNTCKLIEAAAENIANALLLCYPQLDRVDITLKKPWAPVGLPLTSIGVTLSRSRHKVYIGLGSNMGDKKGYLDFALKKLEDTDLCRIKKVSEYITTEPVGYTDQDEFLNACAELDTVLSPSELLDVIHGIEAEAGRERTIHWGPRTLDIDILLYDDEVICTDDLIIPHPEMTKRRFVLEPLSAIAPYAYHPVAKEYVINLFEGLKENDRS